jgi:hypothetical protein
MLNAFSNREPGPLIQYWAQASDARMQISDAHMNEADRIFEGAGMVQGHEALGSFHFARGDILL